MGQILGVGTGVFIILFFGSAAYSSVLSHASIQMERVQIDPQQWYAVCCLVHCALRLPEQNTRGLF